MKYLIFILLLFLVIIRHFTTRPVYKNGDAIRIRTTVYSDPVNYSTSQYLKIGRLKIYLPKFPEISYGDQVVVEGTVNGGKLDKAKLVSLEKNRALLGPFRNGIIAFYQSVLPQPMAGLTAGIVLGSKGALSTDFWNSVKNAGVAHVVVASGTNVTFVVSFLFSAIALLLPRRKAIPIVILGVVLYLFISGFEAPLIRAAIMAVLVFTAQEAGRLTTPFWVLLLTGGIMLVIRPDWIGDIGFILSFVSTGSIMLFQRKLNHWFRKVPALLSRDLTTTTAAQIGIAPILFVTFGQFNIWSVIANCLILWTIPYVMILGSLGGAVGLVFPAIGKIILWLSYPLTWWFCQVVRIFG
jgi:ComEC/Rec2-related protein